MGEITAQLNATNPGWDLLERDSLQRRSFNSLPRIYDILLGACRCRVLGLPQTAVRGMGFKDTQSMHRAMMYGTVVVGILMIGMHFCRSAHPSPSS